MIESGYKPRVKSPANAGGMWQFIPGTAVDQGLRIDEWVDERFDPLKSTRAAARYLRKQYDLFGSWPLAMAAYNGGAGTVSKAINTYNATDYFKLVEYGAMYDETRRYVPRIMAAAAIGKNLESFGFEGLQLHESWSYELVQVPGGVRLSLLADAAGTELDTLRELNPELLADQTPPGDDYSLRIPNGSSSRFVSAFDELAERYGTEHERLTLRFGESVEMVAARVGIPERVLREVNGLSSRERAAYGSVLIVPLANRKPAGTSSADEKPLVVLPSEDFAFSNRSRYFYRVNRGDSVEELSEFFGLRSQQLALWNDLDAAAKLRDGMVLQVFLDDDFDRSQAILMDETAVEAVLMGSDEHQAAEAKRGKSSASKKGKSYTVKKGDTVSKIAKKFGVKSQDLIRWNNLDKKGTIRKGMRLVIYSK
jgi:membrane-bound lytic murein transglycosylase D